MSEALEGWGRLWIFETQKHDASTKERGIQREMMDYMDIGTPSIETVAINETLPQGSASYYEAYWPYRAGGSTACSSAGNANHNTHVRNRGKSGGRFILSWHVQAQKPPLPF